MFYIRLDIFFKNGFKIFFEKKNIYIYIYSYMNIVSFSLSLRTKQINIYVFLI